MVLCTNCPAARETAAKKRYRTLLRVAEDVTGAKMDNTRSYRSVLIRRFVACRMRDDNFTIMEIAKSMGVHHSTVCHYLQQMRDCVDEPIFYAKELDAYFKFVEYVREEDANEN